ncbi:proline dehydrogenase [Effusibacillus lacus]|uniref:Proline dehydrogenase n=1 Tax=Effusibacillus lacus TaxID=1348429 RepID=A0A292YJB4_9BACL|nr:L-proline dehydrogenase [Effusibacillus lacus]GAX88999.1 proline dehydrogenase [Effusibacillus lacus]
MFSTGEMKVIQALRSIARNEQVKAYVKTSKELYPLLWGAARRFVAGEARQQVLPKLEKFVSSGYRASLDFIGENTSTVRECESTKEEYVELIDQIGGHLPETDICLDLSHTGLTISPELALNHLSEIAAAAKRHRMTVMVSMEESAKTESILQLYQQTSTRHLNVGITVQANLNRTTDDLRELMKLPGKIRLVKGAYLEPSNVALSRSVQLNERYLSLVDKLVTANHPVAIATHDEAILDEVSRRGYLPCLTSKSKCYTESARTCSPDSRQKGIGHESICRMERNGSCISATGWLNFPQTCMRQWSLLPISWKRRCRVSNYKAYVQLALVMSIVGSVRGN